MVSGVEVFNKIFEKLVIKTITIDDDLLLGICNIEADPDLNFRERERKSVQGLLRYMLHDDTVVVDHNGDGKPTIPGYNISITHTRGYAAVILSKNRHVGVDIEYISNRVGRIAQRFLRPDELATLNPQSSSLNSEPSTSNLQPSTFNFLKAWCAKEAVYKYYSGDHLAYADMRCTIVDATHFDVDNIQREETVRVAFQLTDAYVLAWVE